MHKATLALGACIVCAAWLESRASSWDPPPPPPEASERLAKQRHEMVKRQIEARGVEDSVVLDAMRVVPRHQFIPPQFVGEAYDDMPLPIGYGQTISQPYIVGAMTEALRLKPRDRVLEVGTGSGYQAAVLAEIVQEVCTIEIVEALGKRAESTLATLGYKNIATRIGDGYRGWPEKAPFDAIIVTAAPDHVPPALLEQLVVGGRLVMPVGEEDQSLYVITKTESGSTRKELFPVRFVPMTGEADSPGSPPPDSGK